MVVMTPLAVWTWIVKAWILPSANLHVQFKIVIMMFWVFVATVFNGISRIKIVNVVFSILCFQ